MSLYGLKLTGCQVDNSFTFNLCEDTQLSDSTHRERLSRLRVNGGVALEELRYDFTSRLQAHRRRSDI